MENEEKDPRTKAEWNGSDAAFARPYTEFNNPQPGLTKREYFAAMALQAFISNQSITGTFMVISDDVAEAACKYADKLLLKLEETASK